MPNDPNESASWQACPPGTLADLSRRVRRRHWRRSALGVGVTIAGLTVVALAISLPMSHREREFHFGGLTCSQVQAALPGYYAGTLAPGLTARVRQHLLECPQCGSPALGERVPVAQRSGTHRHLHETAGDALLAAELFHG